MRKNVVFYTLAIALFVFSFLSFKQAYEEMLRYQTLTERSILVHGNFHNLSRQINNAAIVNPLLVNESTSAGMPGLFFTDSATVISALDNLQRAVIDSVNIRLAANLAVRIRAELPWLLRSNVPDSIIHHKAIPHLSALRSIDSLIALGVSRTNYLFRYRQLKLDASISEVKTRIIVFLSIASILLGFLTLSFFRQKAKRSQKEDELKSQDRKFRALVENSYDIMALVDGELNALYRSPSARQVTGVSSEERRKNPAMDAIHPDDKEKIKQCLEEMKNSPGKVVPVAYRIKHKQGHYIWLEGTFSSLFHDPDIQGIVVNMRDVTERKIAEEELEKREKRFSQTLENMLEGVQIIDFNWRYVYVNPALTRYSTYSREGMIGKTVQEIYPGVEATELYAVLTRCMKDRISSQLESEFVFPNGTKKFFELSVQPAPEGIFILSVDITERKKALEKLEQSMKELADYKYALDESAIVAITDQKGIIHHVNDNFCRISKYSKAELIGQDHRLINSGYHSPEFIRSIWTTIANGKIWKGELRNIAKDRTIYWVATAIVPFLNEAGKPYQYIAIRSDITERKKAEDEIIKINRLYAFISAINQSIVHIDTLDVLLKKACDIAVSIGKFKMAWFEMRDPDGRLRIASISGEQESIDMVMARERFDYSVDDLKDTPVGKALQTGKYAFNNDVLSDPLLSSLKEGFIKSAIRSAISLPIKRSGQIVGVFNLVSPEVNFFDTQEIALLEEAAGDISFALTVFEKNQKQKHTEELLVISEKRFRALIEKSTDLKTLTNKEGFFVYVSPSVPQVFGYEEEEFLSKPAHLFFHPDDLPHLTRKRAQILDKPDASFSFKYRILHKNGHWIWCEGTLTNMLHEPAINALVSNFRDISDKKRAEEQKEFDTNNLNALINTTKDLMWSIDRNFRLITFNRPFFEAIKMATGVEMQQGDSVFSVVLSPQQEENFRGFYRRALSGEAFTDTDAVDGPASYAQEISFYPMRHGDEIIGTACYSRDITERRKAEKEREKMLADLVRHSKNLEQFAYVVSHNLRSPVAHILGISNILQGNIPEADRIKSQEFMHNAVEQLDTIVKDLNKILEVRAAVGQNKEEVDLKEVLNGIRISILDSIQREHVTIKEDLAVTKIRSIKSYIYSIFYNLITNSIKYRNPGRLPAITITCEKQNGMVRIVFKDNGVGMNLDQYGDKLFGLYQRFHLNVSGKGLGLFMVKTQLEVLDGKITVHSNLNEGTEFIIELPDTEDL